jgi:hypothetical protein
VKQFTKYPLGGFLYGDAGDAVCPRDVCLV